MSVAKNNEPSGIGNIKEANLSFDQLMQIYNHIGEEERHFNNLEMEYRKLTSQWLLVSLGAIGFIISNEKVMSINIWALVIGICIASSLGILVLWLLDLKVYHELLHGAFKEGVLLENKYPKILPKIRNNMAKSQTGGDIISKVILYYFFSILILLIIANIAIWMFILIKFYVCIIVNISSIFILIVVYKMMSNKSKRQFNGSKRKG